MSKYSELFKDPRWQKRRLEILERDGFKCVSCGWDKEELNVHHKWYDKGKSPWQYSDECLVTLCNTCHKREHISKEKYQDILITSLYSKGLLSSNLLELALSFSTMSNGEILRLINPAKLYGVTVTPR